MLAGDASARRYDRLIREDGARAVLMDADPAQGQEVRAFVRIADWLVSEDLSAPRVLAADEPAGLLLLEDFGDALFSRLAAADPAGEANLYAAAVDMLLALRVARPPTGLRLYSAATMAGMIAPVFDWYARPLGAGPDAARRTAIEAALEAALTGCADAAPVFCLRDCHAENLVWLAHRQGVRRVGLLDFQDAVIAHPAYDLASLLQDARRDVPREVADTALRRYADGAGMDPDALRRACAAQGAQRHLRILGVFGRLSLEAGKPGYVDLIPRVWRQLQSCLSAPGMEALAAAIEGALPDPTGPALARLRNHAA